MTITHWLIDRIYNTGYFTNHGPIANELEEAIEQYFSIKNAIVISNETLAMVIALSGMISGGAVAVSTKAPEHVVNGVKWAGLEPKFFDTGSEFLPFLLEHRNIGSVEPKFDLVIVDPVAEKELGLSAYQAFCDSKLEAIVYHTVLPQKNDLLHSSIATVRICTLGVNSGSPSSSCAVILTSNNELAAKCRNIRSSYGARKTVSVMATANGRVSEYQAGVALKFIEDNV